MKRLCVVLSMHWGASEIGIVGMGRCLLHAFGALSPAGMQSLRCR